MNILIVSATENEIKPLYNFVCSNGKELKPFQFLFKQHNIYILVSGPGALQTSFAISQHVAKNKVDVAFNAGICGAFKPTTDLGVVYQIIKDRMADFGAEESDGSFTDIFEMGLVRKNDSPYIDGWLVPLGTEDINLTLPQACGISVNKVSGTLQSINLLRDEYDPDIESMEGAGFFYACNMLNIPSFQIRSVSNLVEPRNRNKWNIPLAIDTLNTFLIKLLNEIS